jgi:hypothetical protein
MNRTNVFPVSQGPLTAQMLAGEPIRVDGMKLVFDQKVSLYPAKLRVEDENGDSGPGE